MSDDKEREELEKIDKLVEELDNAEHELDVIRHQMRELDERSAALRGISRNRLSMWHYMKKYR